ncbi:MAG: hypothetical protein ACI875_000470 [Planctomycetota bacterium]|jgi:hypothetical protein
MDNDVSAKPEQTVEPKRTAPKLTKKEDGSDSLTVESNTQLQDLFGVKSQETANDLLNCAFNALGNSCDSYRGLMLSMAIEIEPRDAIETMLVSQLTATHVKISLFSQRIIDTEYPNLREGYERSLTRLSRTFLAQMDALKKYRSVPPHHVHVGQVSVQDGGQAIVGSVQVGD